MNAKKWMPVFSIALSLCAFWYVQQDAETQSNVTVASTPLRPQPAPQRSDLGPAQSSGDLKLGSASTQPVKKTIVPVVVKGVEEFGDWQRELVAGLIATNDADSLMTAALVLHALYAADKAEQRKIRALLERAYLSAPGDRAIASVALRVCRSMPGCNPARFETAVRNIDVHNALGPMPEILYKIEKGNAKQVTEALQRLGELRLNLYNAELVARVARAIARTPTSPRFAPPTGDLLRLQSELALQSVGIVEVPSYLVLGAACQEWDWQNRRACDAIVNDLNRSELLELQRLGLEIEAAQFGNRSKRPAGIEDAEAYLNWLGSMKANAPAPPDRWVELLAQYRTELAASKAWLELKGVSPRRMPGRWL